MAAAVTLTPMNLDWSQLTIPLVIVSFALVVVFLLAWGIRSWLARRTVERLGEYWDDQIRIERVTGNQLRAKVNALHEEARQGRDHLRAAEETSGRLATELEAQIRALVDSRNQRDFLDLDLARVKANTSRLTERIEALAPLTGQIRALEQQVAAEHARAALLSEKLDQVVAKRNELDAERTRIAARVAEVEGALHEAGAMAGEQHARQSQQAEAWRAERTRLRAELAEADRRHEGALGLLREALAERDGLRTAIRDAELASQAAFAELESQLGAIGAQAARVEPLRRQLEDREQLIRVLAEERDLGNRDSTARERAAAIEAERLRARIADLELRLKQAVERDGKLRELELRLSKVQRERDQLATTLQRYSTELETQKQESKDRDQRFRTLADDFRSTMLAKDQEIAGLRAHGEGLEAQLQELALDAASDAGRDGTGSVDGDDLKRIRGIGPAIERVLNDQGVYLFSQIATWTAEDVARIAETLRAFPDRIGRDDWISSARAEHVRKYGAEP